MIIPKILFHNRSDIRILVWKKNCWKICCTPWICTFKCEILADPEVLLYENCIKFVIYTLLLDLKCKTHKIYFTENNGTKVAKKLFILTIIIKKSPSFNNIYMVVFPKVSHKVT